MSGTPVCSSSSNPSMQCRVVGVQFQVTNMQYYSPNQPIIITLNSIYNPSALVGIGSIAVSGVYGSIEMATASISIPAGSFTYDIPRIIAATPTYQAGDTVDLEITFRFAHFSMVSDVIEITFPSDFTMPTALSAYSISGSNTAFTPAITFNSGNGSFTFAPFSINSITRASLNITITGIPRPRECKTTANFSIRSYR